MADINQTSSVFVEGSMVNAYDDGDSSSDSDSDFDGDGNNLSNSDDEESLEVFTPATDRVEGQKHERHNEKLPVAAQTQQPLTLPSVSGPEVQLSGEFKCIRFDLF